MTQFRKIEDGYFIGPQPTEQDLQEARQQGIKTVIDFRMPSETEVPNDALVKNNGLNYANVPVNKASPSAEQIDDLDKALQQSEGPFLLHCATGARAAMLLALSRAKQQGWSTERTFDEAKSMGYDLKGSPVFSAFVTQQTQK